MAAQRSKISWVQLILRLIICFNLTAFVILQVLMSLDLRAHSRRMDMLTQGQAYHADFLDRVAKRAHEVLPTP